jgi:WhiB family transcriptional regulator, redox-sensing transcriptional regulator
VSHNLDWMSDAACADHPNPDIFFGGDLKGVAATAQTREAAMVCRTCPVAAQCLEHKTISGAAHGVWAGGVHRTKALGRSPASYGGPAQHGTDRRYRQHIRDGEKPCQACWAAHSAHGAPNGRSKYTGVTN